MRSSSDIITSSENVHLCESQLEDSHLPYSHSLADMVVQNLTGLHYFVCHSSMSSSRDFNEE